MSWIQVNQNQIVEPAPPPATGLQYRIEFVVAAAEGIERELFVFRTNDDAFSHVATIEDLRLYSSNKATAQANDDDFYRRAEATLILRSQVLASKATKHTQDRLKRVNLDWGRTDTTEFGGIETIIYDSEQP